MLVDGQLEPCRRFPFRAGHRPGNRGRFAVGDHVPVVGGSDRFQYGRMDTRIIVTGKTARRF